MEKLIMFLVILTLGWLESVSGQTTKYPPIVKYNMEGYVVQDFENFAIWPSEFSRNFQKELLSYVNRFLKDTRLDEKYGKMEGEEGVQWIFSSTRTWVEHRTYENGFWNTHKNGVKVVPYWDEREFNGSIMVLHVDGYELDLAKDICMNLVNVPYLTPKVDKKEKEEKRRDDFLEKERYSKNILLPVDDGGGDLIEDPNENQTEVDLGILKDERTRSRFYYWQKKNGWWAYPLTAIAIGTATGFVANKEGYYWYKWFPKYSPHGTMSGGREWTEQTGTTTTEPPAGRGN